MIRHINLDKFCYSIKKTKLERDMDYPICLSGFEGVGKSTLAIIIALKIDQIFKEDPLGKMTRNIIQAPSVEVAIREADRFFHEEPAGSVPIFDEFGDLADKTDYASIMSRILKKMFTKNRQANMCPIFCIPNFFDLNKYFREWRVRCYIFVYWKGNTKARYVMFKSRPNPVGLDVWDLQNNQKIWKKYTEGKDLTPRLFIKTARKLSIYRGEGTFYKNDLSPEIQKLYKKLKNGYYQATKLDKEDIQLDLKDSKKTIILKEIISLIRMQGVDVKTIVELTGLSADTIANYCKVIPRKRSEELFDIILSKGVSNLLKTTEGLTVLMNCKELTGALAGEIAKQKAALARKLEADI